MPRLPQDDVRSVEALRDPHRFFRRLRARDPVHWSDASHAWILTGHTEVWSAFRDARLSSDRITPIEKRLSAERRRGMGGTFDLLRAWMVFRDPPEHDRLRAPLRRLFTPRAVQRLAPRIRAIVDELIDEMSGSGECELVRAFSFPLPAIVIAELLGVPPEDREEFKTWSSKLAGLVFGAVEQPDRYRLAREATEEFTEYFEALIRRYEAEPADNLISTLIAARDRGDALTHDQMVGACTLLLFGGHETTSGLITNGVATLLEHPDELERLRRDLGLVPSAVEEFLRFEGPAKMMVRQVAEPHERGGHELRAGQRVYLSLAGANRDPTVFPEPDRFDVERRPNPHVAFGHGLHFCLGAHLARLEVRIAIDSLLRRFPKMRLATDHVVWGGTILGRGIPELPLLLSEAREDPTCLANGRGTG
jgi:cytochrome P450